MTPVCWPAYKVTRAPQNEAGPVLADRPCQANRKPFGYWIVPTDQKKVSPELSATPSLSVIT